VGASHEGDRRGIGGKLITVLTEPAWIVCSDSLPGYLRNPEAATCALLEDTVGTIGQGCHHGDIEAL